MQFIQIWVYPEKRDLPPSYEQKSFASNSYENVFLPIVTNGPSEVALNIHQDATFYLGEFYGDQVIKHTPRSKQHGNFLYVIDGEIALGEKTLKSGDAAEITFADSIDFQTITTSKVILLEVGVNTL